MIAELPAEREQVEEAIMTLEHLPLAAVDHAGALRPR